MKWEYEIAVIADLGNATASLNAYGDRGWELVDVVVLEMPVHTGSRDIAVVFKRPKNGNVAPARKLAVNE